MIIRSNSLQIPEIMSNILLLIDIQNDYFPGGKMELAHPVLAAENTAKILQLFRKKVLPVIYMQHIADKKASFFNPHTKGIEINSIVQPTASEIIIQKSYPNSFRNTNLLELIRDYGMSDLVICGMMTHMCIESTVRAAYDLGFNCTIISDACATKDLIFDSCHLPAENVQKTFLSALDGTFGKVMSTIEYLKNN